MITMYTDGSFNTQQNVGGWAAIVISDGLEKEYSGSSEDAEGFSNKGNDKATAQRMEIVAVLEGLLTLTEPSDVEIISDSQYVVNTMNKGWLKSWIREGKMDKKHLDLWRVIYTLSNLHNLKFTWVKGHAGNHYNERCDTLAQSETKRLVTLIEIAREMAPQETTINDKQLNNDKPKDNIVDEVSVKDDSPIRTPKRKRKKKSSKKKKKVHFYAVAKGRKKGIFNNWNECSKSVNKYKGAIFKKFDTEEEALRFIEDNS